MTKCGIVPSIVTDTFETQLLSNQVLKFSIGTGIPVIKLRSCDKTKYQIFPEYGGLF